MLDFTTHRQSEILRKDAREALRQQIEEFGKAFREETKGHSFYCSRFTIYSTMIANLRGNSIPVWSEEDLLDFASNLDSLLGEVGDILEKATKNNNEKTKLLDEAREAVASHLHTTVS